MIRFSCPACKKTLKVADFGSGRKSRCPRCGQKLLIPELPQEPKRTTDNPLGSQRELLQEEDRELAGEDLDPSVDEGAFEAAFARRRRTRLIWLFVMIGLTVCMAVWIWSIHSSASKTIVAKQDETERAVQSDRFRDPLIPRQEKDSVAERLLLLFIGGFAVLFAVVAIVAAMAYVTAVVYFMVWVARDADNRGHEGGVWAVIYIVPHFLFPVVYTVVFFFPLLLMTRSLDPWILGFGLNLPFSWFGLLVYLSARRHGSLSRCGHCGNKRLEYVLQCPHCGFGPGPISAN